MPVKSLNERKYLKSSMGSGATALGSVLDPELEFKTDPLRVNKSLQ
jgi:hypothetical protein